MKKHEERHEEEKGVLCSKGIRLEKITCSKIWVTNRGSRVELNRTIRHKSTAISKSSNNPFGSITMYSLMLRSSPQQLVANQCRCG